MGSGATEDAYRERDRAVWQRIFASVPRKWLDAPPSWAMERCRAYFRAHPPERLLDLGCGFGRWAVFLSEGCARRIVGVDYAENGVRVAKALAHRRRAEACFVTASALSLPFRRGSFDGVLAAVLLDNLSRADRALAVREMNDAVREGARGFFVFNPYLSEAERASIPDDNPTKDCMLVAYEDAELPLCLPGWAVTRMDSTPEGFRTVEAIYRGARGP